MGTLNMNASAAQNWCEASDDLANGHQLTTRAIDPSRSERDQLRSTSAAFTGVLIFLFVYCARPSDWIPGAGVIPFAKIVGVLALAAFLLSVRSIRRKFPPEVIYLLVLLGHLSLSVPFSPVWRGGAFWRVVDFSKVVLITVVMAMSVISLRRLRRVIFVQTASVLLVAAVALVKGSFSHGRLEGVLGGDFNNPNDLALVLGLNLPLAAAFLFSARGFLRKAGWVMAVGVMLFAILRTGSRGGFLVLITVLAVCLWEFAVKGRRYYVLLLGAIIVFGGWFFASDELAARLQATFDPAAETERSAYGSAKQRQELFWRSIEVTLQHPLFGVGPGNFTTVSGVWRTSHNSYTLMSSEGGFPALILYLMILWRAAINIRRARQLQQGEVRRSLLAGALRASVFGYLVGSFFASVAYNFFPYLLVAYTSALVYAARVENRERAAAAGSASKNIFDKGLYGQMRSSNAI